MKFKALWFLICILLVAALGLIAWRSWPSHLLGLAATDIDVLYSKYRPLPYRWAGAPYGATKNGSSEICAAVPESELANADLQLARAQRFAKQDARLLQLLGRTDILRCHP